MKIPESSRGFVKSFVERFPSLSLMLDKQLEEQEGALLPHVFFGDVTRHVIALIRDATPAAQSEAQQIIDFLEIYYGHADGDVQNIIEVSFIENLYQEGDATQLAFEMLGPRLTKSWLRMEAHKQ